MHITKHYDDFDKVFTYLHLYRSSKKAQRNVSRKYSVQKYKYKRNINLYNTLLMLRNGTYKSKGFYEFTRVERGKTRLIKSNHISERVVQKSLCDYCLTPILRTKLIYDNGATLKHKGCEFVLRRTKLFCRKALKESKTLYFLTMDFHSYFENINHEILLEEINKYIKDYKTFALYTHFVKCFGLKGLGLGSQISQISAVFYTHTIDNLIKHNLRCKYYTRYMDDSVIIETSKGKLKTCLSKIKETCANYEIKINEKKTFVSRNHFSFLKRHWSTTSKLFVKPSKDTYYRMMRKLKIFGKWLNKNKLTTANIETSFESWKSHFIRDNAKILVKKANIKYNEFKEIYYGIYNRSTL